MLIVHTPADGEAERFDHRSVRTSEASIVSRTLGKTWKQIKELLADDDPEAMRAIVWVLKKRSTPSLRYDDFDPMLSELTTRLDQQEIEEWVEAAITGAPAELTPEEMEQALGFIVEMADDVEHARASIRRLAAAGKDPAGQSPDPSVPTEESTPTEPSTSDSSPTSSTSRPQP
ncbi:hypothetical protein [Streptomyces sp. NPDC055055]